MDVMSTHPMQYACLLYFTLPDVYFENLAERYKRRVQKLAGALKAMGFCVVIPQGPYYLFVDYREVLTLKHMSSMEAAMHLMKCVGVACVPGDNFYWSNNKSADAGNYLCFAACRSDSDLEEAATRLQRLKSSP
jgi:aspartate/methionine/tyrosine aminotransferase